MHDIADLEARGVPGAFVATVQFNRAADTQSRALGAADAAVYIPHPVQDRTDDEMTKLADDALDALLAALVVKE